MARTERNSRAPAHRRFAAASAVGLMLAACSTDTAMFRADWNWWSRGRPAAARAAPADALVGADGSCPAEAAPSRGVALGMTECDLIRIAGPTDQIAIAANERGERTAVITYPQGERAGVYRFTSGLLVSIEGAPEPPKPQRRQPRAPRS